MGCVDDPFRGIPNLFCQGRSESGMIPLRQMSFPLGHVAGMEIRCHYFVPFLALGLVLRLAWLHPDHWISAAGLIGLFCLALLFHVLIHALTWIFFGAEPKLAVLEPLGGFVEAEGEWGLSRRVWVALSAPLFHAKMAIVFGFLLLLLDPDSFLPLNPFRPPLESPWQDHGITGFLAGWFWVNWVLLLVNLALPGKPYDGAQWLEAILQRRLSPNESEKVTARVGILVAILFAFAAVVDNSVVLLILALLGLERCLGLLTQPPPSPEDPSEFEFPDEDHDTELHEPTVSWMDRWKLERERKKQAALQKQREEDEERLDRLLEKIHVHGKSSLTPEELRFLQERSESYRNRGG